MITDALVTVFLGILGAVFGLFPDMPVFEGVELGSIFGRFMWAANVLLPITHLFAAIGVVLGIRVATGGWHLMEWLWAKMPFKAT